MRTWVFLLGWLLCHGNGQAQSPPFDILPHTNPLENAADSQLHDLATTFLQKSGAQGLIIGFSRNGHKQYYSYGVADPASGRMFGEQTVFEAGSISKTFTAHLVTRLCLQKELDTLASLSAFLPAPGNEAALEAIRIRDLLTHQSGLPRLPDNMERGKGFTPQQPYLYGRDELYQYLKGMPAPLPGPYAYSNLGYGLLGTVLENKTGLPLDTLLRQYILDPLGMNLTGIRNRPGRKDTATGHFQEEAVAYWQFGSMAAAGAVQSTAADLLSYLDAHHLPGSPEAFQAAALLQRAARGQAGPRTGIGLGWHLATPSGRIVYWHNGGTYGFSSFAAYEPRTHTSLVLAANRFAVNAELDKLGAELMKMLTGEK